MAAITPDRLAELEQLEREAWAEYSESLRDLGGRDYEVAEAVSWEDLQRTLAEVTSERDALTAAA